MFYRITESLRRFMQGRHGMDQLGIALLVTAMALSLLYSLSGWFWLSLVYWVVLFLCFFRVLSRNHDKRFQENRLFMGLWSPVQNRLRQLPGAMRQQKEFVLFKCPQCGQKLRLPRGRGMVVVTCHRCKTEFQKKS